MFSPMQNWTVSLETSSGIVGLWSCWLGNHFMLGYPLNFNVEESLIRETLGVSDGFPVSDNVFNTRQWAKFFSGRQEKGGRVWIDQVNNSADSMHINLIDQKKLVDIYYGHEKSNIIETIRLNSHNADQPDGPTCEARAIQAYQQKFLFLALQIAQKLGKIAAINLTVDWLFTLEKLESKGCQLSSGVP